MVVKKEAWERVKFTSGFLGVDKNFHASNPAEREHTRSPSRKQLNGSDLKLCMRLSPAASYSTSGTSVETILDIPGPNLNIKQAPAVADALQVRARW